MRCLPLLPACFIGVFLLAPTTPSLSARDIRPDLKRIAETGKSAAAKVVRNDLRVFWPAGKAPLVYRINPTHDTFSFVQIDPASGRKSPAFDHEKLAQALGKSLNRQIPQDKLPIDDCHLTPDGVQFRADGKSWKFTTATSSISPDNTPPPATNLLSPREAYQHAGDSGPPSELVVENATGADIGLFWIGGNRPTPYGTVRPGETSTLGSYAGHAWLFRDASGRDLAGIVVGDSSTFARVAGPVENPPVPTPGLSPDGKWRAQIRNHNLFITPTTGGDPIALTTDGTPSDRFTGPLSWSPDSSRLVAFRLKPVKERQITIVQSSPPDQLQPKLIVTDYAKPGDPIEQPLPHLFDVAGRREIKVPSQSFNNPWSIDHLEWAPDSSEFSFLYNQRGHQILRLIAVRADSGSARTIFEDVSKTFIDYSQKTWLMHLPETHEILWASERDGNNHLYLIDSRDGSIRARTTQGDWRVRDVVDVDVPRRRLTLKVMGIFPGQDPYQAQFIRVNFDGSDLTHLTESDGNHSIRFSPDGQYLLDTWSRVDHPPTFELRNAATGKPIATLEQADDSALIQSGGSRPERFTAPGRDGKTPIWGVIYRPTHFDPAKRYPIVEDIYAGPQDFFVPKSYTAWSGLQELAEFGFIVVKMDGMGTNWRSKAFHDVCWKNLADGGFPDRIPWIKAAASTRPWMDLSRIGIQGGSAGGQNALAGLLHHGDFYKVGVADCGCHDNRMDKIWWNEAWMGWPVDDSYARNSNVTHAAKLTGKLLLVVGELDTNVDPASSAQVVAALQKADKDFEFLPVMNAGHGAASSSYGKRRRIDFLVHQLIDAPTTKQP